MARNLIHPEDAFVDFIGPNQSVPFTIWYGSEELHEFETYVQQVAKVHLNQLSARDREKVLERCYISIWRSFLAFQPIIRALFHLNSTVGTKEKAELNRQRKAILSLYRLLCEFWPQTNKGADVLIPASWYTLAKQLYRRDAKHDLKKKEKDWKLLLSETWRQSKYPELSDHTFCFNCSRAIVGSVLYKKLKRQKKLKAIRAVQIGYTNGTNWLCPTCWIDIRDYYSKGKKKNIKILPLDYY